MGKVKNIVLVLLFAAFIASLCFNVHFCTRSREHLSTTDTTRITVYDTIIYREPAPVRSTIVATVTDRLPAAPKQESTAAEKADTIQQPEPSIETDSVEVVIPITQRVYEDSLYTAYVSGYEPKLDSIAVYPRREIVTVTNNNYTAPKPKRWSIGVQAGYGVTLKGGTPQPAPYIGIGVSYNLISF